MTPQVMTSLSQPSRVEPGQTVYVQYTYPRSLIDVNDKYFDDLQIDFGDRGGDNVRSVRAPAGWLTMVPADLPEGVSVSLVGASILKEIVSTRETATATQVRFREQVQVTLKVTAAPGANTDDSDVATLVYSDGHTKSPVPLPIRVGKDDTGVSALAF